MLDTHTEALVIMSLQHIKIKRTLVWILENAYIVKMSLKAMSTDIIRALIVELLLTRLDTSLG